MEKDEKNATCLKTNLKREIRLNILSNNVWDQKDLEINEIKGRTIFIIKNVTLFYLLKLNTC